ncbi:hypothetical protein Acr_14g0009780 [Actinidia rufa]|uniref:Uncharacterized protein n=1 Tax=Actinidia rufa TaxID=165716 RepID=A0A7J0FRK4_9ERIC|nr:hypothetical protein Acr_14g0009780 [Actinidia rufa]
MRKRDKNWAQNHMGWATSLRLGWDSVAGSWTGLVAGGAAADIGLRLTRWAAGLFWAVFKLRYSGLGLHKSRTAWESRASAAGGACGWCLVACNRGRGCCFDCTRVGTAQKRGQGGNTEANLVGGGRIEIGRCCTKAGQRQLVAVWCLDKGESGLHRDGYTE